VGICKTALIHPEANIGKNVSIGPYGVIGNCTIEDNCIIHSHAYIGDCVTLRSGVEVFNGAVIGKEPKGAGSTARPIDYQKVIMIGHDSSIGPHAIIYYDVEMGSKNLIGDGASIREQCKIGNNCIISRYVTINYNTKIGNHVKIMDNSHITGNMIIEDEVFISALVGTANDNQIRAGYGAHVVGPLLKQGCIIGLGAKLMPNITVDKQAFVASGALVTKDVEEGKRVMGIPAKCS
jgi:acetyltransferase-like isoleucine patch superfamily enzyme